MKKKYVLLYYNLYGLIIFTLKYTKIDCIKFYNMIIISHFYELAVNIKQTKNNNNNNNNSDCVYLQTSKTLHLNILLYHTGWA